MIRVYHATSLFSQGGQGKTNYHRGGLCVGKRTVANPVYYNGDMQKREGAAMALPSMGMVPHQAKS